MLKKYRKYIVENRATIYISTIVALIIRFLLFESGNVPAIAESGLIWNIVSPVLSVGYVSFFVSFVLSIGIAILISGLNDKFTIIRVKTYLPYVFFILLSSIVPSFVLATPSHISLFLVLLSVFALFNSYQEKEVAANSFRIGFLLALGSLFSFYSIVYLPLFWFGFYIMKSFSIKTIISSLLGVLAIYWLFSFYLLFRDEFLYTLNSILEESKDIALLDIAQMKESVWFILSATVLFLSIVMVKNYINEFKNKIKVRCYISFLNVTVVFSLFLYVAFSFEANISLMVFLSMFAVIAANYFALIERKTEIIFFIFSSVLYFLLMAFLIL
ncbi:MAG: hypothetical protein ACLVKO_04870 [Dysgonomonas sp.]